MSLGVLERDIYINETPYLPSLPLNKPRNGGSTNSFIVNPNLDLHRLSFRAQVRLPESNFRMPFQKFCIRQSHNEVILESESHDDFPTVRFVINESNDSVVTVPKPATKSSLSEVLYTGFFLELMRSKSFSLVGEKDEIFFELRNGGYTDEQWDRIEYRSKLFHKVLFIEKMFGIQFEVPENIVWREAMAIETLFRGLTEGEFTFPAGKNFRVPFNTLGTADFDSPPFSAPGAWTYSLPDEVEVVFGLEFQVGKRTITAQRARLGNPRILTEIRAGNPPSDIRIDILDHSVTCRFEKYLDDERLKQNRAKLNKFKAFLSTFEPTDLVARLQQPLASIPSDVAVEIIQGILQFYDFPDRFGISAPILEMNRWHSKIGLYYSENEPIWLANVYVDRSSGQVDSDITFEELLSTGRRRAKEVVGAL